ncbi:hypothetical protein AB0I72_09785 [Nocardiopsis sp. NPDC049922]
MPTRGRLHVRGVTSGLRSEKSLVSECGIPHGIACSPADADR